MIHHKGGRHLYQAIGLTDVGKVRTQNQDSYLFKEVEGLGLVLLVCDGMGGAKAGNVASAKAVQVMMEMIMLSAQRVSQSYSIRDLLTDGVVCANQVVYEMSQKNPDLEGMGTTAVAALLAPDGRVSLVHVGDSRAYLIGEQPRLLTRDHTIVQMMVEQGQLTAKEAKYHPKRNLITRALGVEETVETDYNEAQLALGESLLLCTDGLTSFAEEQEIFSVLRKQAPDQALEQLVALANSGGGGDNITAVLAYETDPGRNA